MASVLASVYVPMIFCDTPDLGAFDRLSLHCFDGGLRLSCANDIVSPRSPLSLRACACAAYALSCFIGVVSAMQQSYLRVSSVARSSRWGWSYPFARHSRLPSYRGKHSPPLILLGPQHAVRCKPKCKRLSKQSVIRHARAVRQRVRRPFGSPET